MACSDVQTIQAGNGTKTQFSFDFPYIFKSEIHVYFWNAVTKEYDEKLTTDATYPWQITDANPTIVEFTGTAPPSPATPVDPGEPTVDNVKIRRITQVDDIRALFNPGSAIRSDDLNKNFEQLRYAIQEANCQGIPDDVDAYLKEYYWDRFDNTLYSADTWRSDDATIATTAALDQRFQDEVSETFTKSELAAASNQMPDNDTAVPTTGALNDYINEVITNDIAGSDGVSITDDGDGTITVGLTDNSVDFDKIKDADQIKVADQVADPDAVGTDNNIFTAQAATRRFNNYYQNDAPATTDGIGIGQVWVDPNDDLTLSVWSGSNWVGVTSGGTFTNQPKVIYVDATSGDDTNDGHRISRPKKTIEAALSDINSDSVYGDGSIISVAPGIYAETLPLDIQKNDVGIIGQSLRTCIIHPKIPTSDQPSYGVNTPHSQELQTMFRVNSGSYFANLTLTGLKASGTRGDTGSLYTDSTYGLPPNQGWNFGFYPNAVIKKSPYIQNVTNFSDSQINNVTFTPHTPGEGAAGDLDSAPCGGGILIDGSVPDTSSPLRSMVCDSYTHTALDGPGIFVTNNGYCQATSSYAFFNHAHITCVNGGQANLAASTTDFGRFGLIADGKSSTAIFTSNVDGAANSGDTTFNINAPAAGSGWFGDATRPQDNMLVTVNSVTYPVISASSYTDSEGGNGWTVTISRPDPNDTSSNLGLNGAVSDNAAVSFFLRSMIASSGHTMEYVGSGTDYTALPENGGVPVDGNQIVERNDGKVWSAITDHKGTFKLGNFFTIDQQAGSLTINDGSFKVNLETLDVDVSGNAVFGAPLDMGSNQITSSSGNLKLNASGDIDAQTNKIINVTDPTAAQDAATKNYVDNNFIGEVVDDGSPQLGGNLDVNGNEIISTSNGDITINPNGTGDIVLDANVGIGTTSPAVTGLTIENAGASQGLELEASNGFAAGPTVRGYYRSGSAYKPLGLTGSQVVIGIQDVEKMRIDSSGRLLVGTSSELDTAAGRQLQVSDANGAFLVLGRDDTTVGDGPNLGGVHFYGKDTTNNDWTKLGTIDCSSDGVHGPGDNPTKFTFSTTADGASSPTPRMTIDSSGNVGIGTTSPINSSGYNTLTIGNGTSTGGQLLLESAAGNNFFIWHDSNGANIYNQSATSQIFYTNAFERMRIDSSGNVGVGTNNALRTLHVAGAGDTGLMLQTTNAVNDNEIWEIQVAGNASNYADLIFRTRTNAGTGGSEALRIDSSGNVGIGTSSPSSLNANANNLVVGSGSGSEGITIYSGTTANSNIYFADGTGTNAYAGYIQFSHISDTMKLGIQGQDAMYIDSSGRLLVGAPSLTAYGTVNAVSNSGVPGLRAVGQSSMSLGSAALAVDKHANINTTSQVFMIFTINAQGTGSGQINANGASQAAFGSFSDRRLKKNIVDIPPQLENVCKLRPVEFDYIESEGGGHQTSFIAQEFEQVYPDAIGEREDGMKTLTGWGKTEAILVKALQEAVEKISVLEARISALEAQ